MTLAGTRGRLRGGAGLSAAVLIATLSACSSESSPHQGSTASGASSSGSGGGEPSWTARCDIGWCLIPAGRFTIGSPETEWGRGAFGEEQVEVTLTRSFLLQQYEVTVEQWAAFGWPNPSTKVESFGSWCQERRCPMGSLNWFDVVSYANELSKREGRPACWAAHRYGATPSRKMTSEPPTITKSARPSPERSSTATSS